MTIEPFEIFKIYHALFLHYTTDGYDYQKYNGKTAYRKETFEHRTDKYSYHKLKRRFEASLWDYKDIEYYMAWLFFSSQAWVTTRAIAGGQVSFDLEWRNYSRNRLQLFIDDVKRLKSLEPQHLFECQRTGEIHTQAILIFDALKPGLISVMNDKLKGNYMWDHLHQRLTKFRPFYLTHEPIHETTFRPHIPETLWAEQ